jgi:hypothetical protein
MADRRPSSGPRIFAHYAVRSMILLACAAACGDKTEPGKAPTKVDAPAKTDEPAATAAAEAGDVKADDAKADTADAKADTADAKADDAKADTGGDAKADTADAKADTGEGGAEPTPAPADPKALITEVKSKKTKDDRALAALAEAETAGAKLRDVAAAANARGETLFATPERATPFFEWSAAKDPKYPEPVFNLAKQAVITGDLDTVIKHLTEVKKRGGKKLLGQIEYDATWELVKDDPAVRKLLGG